MVRVWHHGYQHVEQNDHVYEGVDPEHQLGPELGELLDASELEVRQANEAEGAPEEGLQGLEQVGEPFPDQTGGSAVPKLLVLTLPKHIQSSAY